MTDDEGILPASDDRGRLRSRGVLAGPLWRGRTPQLLRRNGDQRQILVAAGLAQREEKHDGGECTLRFPVAVVDPEPVIAVMRGGISVRR